LAKYSKGRFNGGVIGSWTGCDTMLTRGLTQEKLVAPRPNGPRTSRLIILAGLRPLFS